MPSVVRPVRGEIERVTLAAHRDMTAIVSPAKCPVFSTKPVKECGPVMTHRRIGEPNRFGLSSVEDNDCISEK